MSRYADRVYNNLNFRNKRRSFFDDLAVAKCIEKNWKGTWPVDIGVHDVYANPGINYEWQDITSYFAVLSGQAPEIFYALGGFRFGWRQGTTMNVCCSEQRCRTADWKVVATAPGGFIVFDDYTFPADPKRNIIPEYSAGYELQQLQVYWRYRMVLNWEETISNQKLYDCGD